jgi:hypothetical protein
MLSLKYGFYYYTSSPALPGQLVSAFGMHTGAPCEDQHFNTWLKAFGLVGCSLYKGGLVTTEPSPSFDVA